MRIIQHRISRKNSLTLLQLQNLGDINNHFKANKKNTYGKSGCNKQNNKQNNM